MKIDLHVHTKEISLCGHVPVEKVLRLYREHGYDAVVITNHFNRDTANHWRNHGVGDFAGFYFDHIDAAKQLGRRIGITVLGGCELRFDENVNDYLTYGLARETVRDCDRIFALGAVKFGEWARAHGVLFYQAHPFRNGMTITDPAALFGIEVKNGHPRHESRNDIAEAWAKRHDLHAIAGSDCHQECDVGITGIITPAAVRSEADLADVLRADAYQII